MKKKCSMDVLRNRRTSTGPALRYRKRASNKRAARKQSQKEWLRSSQMQNYTKCWQTILFQKGCTNSQKSGQKTKPDSLLTRTGMQVFIPTVRASAFRCETLLVALHIGHPTTSRKKYLSSFNLCCCIHTKLKILCRNQCIPLEQRDPKTSSGAEIRAYILVMEMARQLGKSLLRFGNVHAHILVLL